MSEPSAYERLMREQIPTGRFGGPRTDQPLAPTAPHVAALHYAELEAAVDAHDAAVRDAHRVPAPRHLEAVPDPDRVPHVDPRPEQRPA